MQKVALMLDLIFKLIYSDSRSFILVSRIREGCFYELSETAKEKTFSAPYVEY
jgi:hypothetical protein